MDYLCCFCLVCYAFLRVCLLMHCGHPLGKGWTSGLLFLMSYCGVVTFPLVSWVRCGAWLYRFLIFALFLTFTMGPRLLSSRLQPKVGNSLLIYNIKFVDLLSSILPVNCHQYVLSSPQGDAGFMERKTFCWLMYICELFCRWMVSSFYYFFLAGDLHSSFYICHWLKSLKESPVLSFFLFRWN